LKVTVIGSAAAFPGSGEICSGYLVQQGDTNLLIDCGNGVLSSLQNYIKATEITDIYISHMHADHFFDLIPFRYALYYGFHVAENDRPALYLPPGGLAILENIVSSFAETDTFITDAFRPSEYVPGTPINLAGFGLLPVKVHHYIPSYGVVTTGKPRIAYSSDSGVCDGLRELAREADFMICHVGNTLIKDNSNSWGHLYPDQAGELAAETSVKRLLLSHIRPDNCKKEFKDAAASRFGNWLELARVGDSYEIV
jgi:ribonuclease BN (tRNA processing enzyme)